jgi:hypothetical protein
MSDYTKQDWKDGTDGGTPITAARLAHIEDGIANATTQANTNAEGIKTLGDSVSQYLHFERLEIVTKSTTGRKLGEVTAPEVSGYSFLAWVFISTVGWVGACYFDSPLQATSGVWCAADASTTEGSTQCFALYTKTV